MKHITYKVLFVSFVLILLFESLVQADIELPNVFYISPDKAKHIISAFMLMILFTKAFTKIHFLIGFLFLFISSIGVEFLQYLIGNGRDFDIKDIYANAFGFFSGIIFIVVVEALSKKVKL